MNNNVVSRVSLFISHLNFIYTLSGFTHSYFANQMSGNRNQTKNSKLRYANNDKLKKSEAAPKQPPNVPRFQKMLIMNESKMRKAEPKSFRLHWKSPESINQCRRDGLFSLPVTPGRSVDRTTPPVRSVPVSSVIRGAPSRPPVRGRNAPSTISRPHHFARFVNIVNVIINGVTTGIVSGVVLSARATATPSPAAPHRASAPHTTSATAVHVRTVTSIVSSGHWQARHRTYGASVDAAQLLINF